MNTNIHISYSSFLYENKTIEKSELNANFYKWFGQSKIVDSTGIPEVCYHSTDYKFNSFDKSKQTFGHHGNGFYFANNDITKEYYGKYTLECYLKIENPFDLNKTFEVDLIKKLFANDYKYIESFIEEELEISFDNKIPGYLFYAKLGEKANNILMKHGFDGIIHSEIRVVFNPNQIKSIYNDGTFDINDDNIYS